MKNTFQVIDRDTKGMRGSQDKFKMVVVDKKGKGYLLKDISRTPELGGGSGTKSPPDPHEMMTAALILRYGGNGTKKVPTSTYSTLDKAAEATKKLKKFGDDIVTTESDKDQKIEQFSLNIPKCIFLIFRLAEELQV